MKAVIFDFDGTIADSLAAVIKVVQQINNNYDPLTAEEEKALQNRGLLDVALAMGMPWYKIPYYIIWGRGIFRHHGSAVKVHPGMDKVIKELHKRGVPIFVVSSNKEENVRDFLRKYDLEQYFTRVVGSAFILNKAGTYKKLLREEGLEASDVWCIGDERVDIRSAHRIGAPIIAVTWGYNSRESLKHMHPERLVHDATEIVQILMKNKE
ncbi:MAG: phosphoglycolate phosphatase [Patescibacteria group bacterium]|nr:HAD hydrolase-like protein [Candidatus Saccharibacteria bacterium]MDQ5963591.1 phosphoglycolate phosphatase [Patescibacteria group bacterium]